MPVLCSGLPQPIRWALVCGVAVMSLSTYAQRAAAASEDVPSQLLSDDERIDFCSQMHRAATPQERSAVAARMRDTLTPRAKGQGVALPPWVVEARPASEGANIPGLSCGAGAARPRTPSTAPAPLPVPAQVRQTPERKPPVTTHEALAPAPVPAPVEEIPARNALSGDIPVAHDNHGVPYVTGGVGQDEVAAFRGLASGYNMRATFTTGSGEYLSGVAVQVARADGTVVFNATSDGPYLFARLPQGRYRLTAMLDGAQRSRELYVPARGGVRFTMVWPLLHASSTN